MSYFSGLGTAASALHAHQTRIAVIGDNIANIDTPGYAAQRVELGALGSGNWGVFSGRALQHGVDVIGITRRRDELLENASRGAGSDAAMANAQAQSLQSIETQLGPLREGSFSDQLNQFFNSFDDLGNEPNDPAARQVTLQRAEQIAGSLRSQSDLFNTARADEIGRVTDTVDQINRLVDSIADLNLQVKAGSNNGQTPNSLMARRSDQVAKLAELADIEVVEDLTNELTINLDGIMLVSGGRPTHLSVDSTVDPALAPLGMERITVNAPNGRELAITTGALGGHLATANVTVPGLVADLNAFATQFVADVNAIHATGFGQDGVDGRDLFTLTSGIAGDIEVSADVAGRPDLLGASSTAAGTFNGDIAAQMAALGNSDTGPTKIYDAFVAKLGAATERATFSAEIATQAASHAQAGLDKAIGVSLDEELTELMSAQRAYEASARMVTAIDEMLRTLINSTGLVGR